MKKYIKIIILAIIILSSLTLEITGISVDLSTDYAYVFRPLIWCFIAIITFVFFKNDIIPNHKYKKEVEFYVLITTLIYFLVYFTFGYVNGFATNPYDHSVKGVLHNLWTFMPVLVAKEYARYYMINHSSKKHILLSAFFISLLFAITELNLFKFGTYFENPYTIAKFVMETFLPSLMVSMYLTYISYFASYPITILYALLPQLALFIFPILPNVNWILLAILNSAIPFFSYVFINYTINKMDKTLDRRVYKTVDLKGWLFMMLIIILMVSFGLGVFPYKPLVIASDSMYPKIRKGDIVLIKDIDPKLIKTGDIIRYKMENYYVVHRVKEIQEGTDGKLKYIMKGDNNNNVDLFPVQEYQIEGIIKFNIPYAGYPTLLLSKLLNTNVEDTVNVETGKK